jgi:glucose/mannose transport system substrate-binding protein
MKPMKLAAALCASVALPLTAHATDLEVTHWWTSGGEAAAVAELAKAFDASATSGSTAPSLAAAALRVRS